MFRILIQPKNLLVIGYIALLAVSVRDCLRRREHPFWIIIMLVIHPIGVVLYWAWTRDWIGRVGQAAERTRADTHGRGFAGSEIPAEMQRYGEWLVRRGRHGEAIEVFEQILEREGPSVPLDVRYQAALAYKGAGRYRDGRDQLSLIVGEDPKFRFGQAFLELADCHYQMDEDEKALGLLEQLLRIIRFPEARYKYGILLDHIGKAQAAAEQMNLLLGELDTAPDFHRRNNRQYARLAKRYLRKHG